MAGAANAAYGYKNREASILRVQGAEGLIDEVRKDHDPKNQKPPQPGTTGGMIGPDTGEASLALAKDAREAAEHRLYFHTHMLYIGIGMASASALASVLYASYLIRQSQLTLPD